ncbi:MAG: MurR/RpiR family transcriptional regulator [Tissierellia bacterium]|nr:MurR/RpiR family transcriptional regulator [Tissierellia bacterium]
MNIKKLINKEYDNLTTTQQKISDYLLNNSTDICYTSLQKLSEDIGCTEVTLLNYCRRLGFENYMGLKKAFRSYIESKLNEISTSPQASIISNEKIYSNYYHEDLIKSEKTNLDNFYKSIDTEELDEIISDIINANYIYILGHDASRKLGAFLEMRLDLLNLSPISVDLNDIYKTEFILDQLKKEDLVFYISFPKYYYATEIIASKVANSCGNMVLLTDSQDSPAYDFAKRVLFCPTNTEIFDNSWLSPLACINIITNLLAIKLYNLYSKR